MEIEEKLAGFKATLTARIDYFATDADYAAHALGVDADELDSYDREIAACEKIIAAINEYLELLR